MTPEELEIRLFVFAMHADENLYIERYGAKNAYDYYEHKIVPTRHCGFIDYVEAATPATSESPALIAGERLWNEDSCGNNCAFWEYSAWVPEGCEDDDRWAYQGQCWNDI
jgi:hypothetical protein